MKITSSHKKIFPFQTVESMRVRIAWFINLRWFASIGILISVPIGKLMLNFDLAYPELLIISSILLIINLVYFFIVRHFPIQNEFQELVFAEIQIAVDLVIISFLIHYAGGITNPFFFLYIVHVILSGILFPGEFLPVVNASLAAVLLTVWTLLEFFGIVLSHRLTVQQIPLTLMITALVAFYITNFSAMYIIKDFLQRFRFLKKVIDEKNEQLEKAIEDRSRAFRFAAHELKSPVTAISSTLGVAKSLLNKDSSSELWDMIERAERRTDQVLEMVKEVITITQYNLDLAKLIKEKIEFNDWLSLSVQPYLPSAIKKNIKLNVGSTYENLFVEVDKSGLEKVIGNLLSNAIRYTPEGGSITVEPFVTGTVYGFSVRDTGIGIPKNEINKIFNEFYRTKEARRMEQIGTGLGLNMVKEIVERNGGEIVVQSTPGKGSVFSVKFPLPKEMLTPVDL